MRLGELTKAEWREVVRVHRPHLTDAEYERLWQCFIRARLGRTAQ